MEKVCFYDETRSLISVFNGAARLLYIVFSCCRGRIGSVGVRSTVPAVLGYMNTSIQSGDVKRTQEC